MRTEIKNSEYLRQIQRKMGWSDKVMLRIVLASMDKFKNESETLKKIKSMIWEAAKIEMKKPKPWILDQIEEQSELFSGTLTKFTKPPSSYNPRDYHYPQDRSFDALRKCRACNQNIYKHARKCPHCGAPYPGSDTQYAIAMVAMVLLVLWVIFTFF